MGADAGLDLVPVGTLGVGLRVRRGRGRNDARPRDPAPGTRGGRCLFEGPHRRALPRRRRGWFADRRHDRRGDGARGGIAPPSSRAAPRPHRAGCRVSEARTAAPARAFDRRLMRLAMTERRTLAGSVVLGLVVAAARIATGISIALAISRVLE